jgi:hypothetical protein
LERGQLGEEPLMVLFLMKFNKATMLQGNGENASYICICGDTARHLAIQSFLYFLDLQFFLTDFHLDSQ